MVLFEIAVFLVVLNLYLGIVYVLRKKDLLDGERLSMMGPALMLKTHRGKGLIDRIAGPKEFWRKYGDLTIAVVVAFGVLMVAFIGLGLVRAMIQPPQRGARPQELLAIPGLNPWIPIGYGVMALALGMVFHEFAHGIVARAHDLKVKALGLLVFIVPVGAFMEPDEDELMDSHPRTKTRVFAAGAGTSILISFVFAAVFSYAFIPMAQPAAPGIGVTAVSPESPADDIGVTPGMILTSVDGQVLETGEDFRQAFNGAEPGQTVRVVVHSDGTDYVRNATLVDRQAYEQRMLEQCKQEGERSDEECERRWTPSEDEQGEAFFGIGGISPERFLSFQQPSLDRRQMSFYLFAPVAGFSPVNSPFANFFTIQGPASVLGLQGFWMLANSFYWLFWLNFLIGTFNALPLAILDGGHVFDEGVRKIVRTVRPEMPAEQVDRRVEQASKAAGLLILGALVALLLIPYLF